MKCLLSVTLVFLGAVAAAQAQGPKLDSKVPGQVKDIIARYCYRCHGQNSSAEGGFTNALDFKVLTGEGGKVRPGDSRKSRLFKRMGIARDMPPEEEKERPSDAEIELVKTWIDAGAPHPSEDKTTPREFITSADELKAINGYLRDPKMVPRQDRAYIRFFTMTHLHNKTPQGLPGDRELRLYRAALSKLLNSLSWKSRIVVPRAVDKHQTIFAVDIRDLDWDLKRLWLQVISDYPYGLKHHQYPQDEALNELANEIYEITGTEIPAVRVDWFVANASRPPLYDILVQVPKHASELEKKLDVDIADNFNRGVLKRAGFTQSGVSGHNRLVERHPAKFGAYWKSYDFKSSSGSGNLYVYPLGPLFKENPFTRHAFKQDGGEIIFNLPNGLQGYMLVNGKDERIEFGPIEVVSDPKKRSSGTPAIVNGLSCMVCHQHGSIPFTDRVRDSHILGDKARLAVEQLYPKKNEMDQLVKEDEDRFVAALERAIGPFLKVDEDKGKDIRDFPEPIYTIAKYYLLQDITAQEAAMELGVKEVAKLQGRIDASPELKRAGLSPLVNGGTIKRETWEFLEFRISPFQETARIVQAGTPIIMKSR